MNRPQSPAASKRRRGVCTVPDCGRVRYMAGLCTPHYRRSTGEIDPEKPVGVHTRLGEYCTHEQCARPPAARGLCWAHYQRLIGRSKATGPAKRTRPTAQSSRTEHQQTVIDEAEHLLGSDTADDIARRLGYKDARILSRTLYRWGATDLARRYDPGQGKAVA